MNHEPTYQRIYLVVRQIPRGKVATYGQIAAIVGSCTPRMVGYAMAALQGAADVPWQRVVNAQGKISPRADGGGSARQQMLLEEEGIPFGKDRKLDLRVYRWAGPPLSWLLEHGYDPAAEWRED